MKLVLGQAFRYLPPPFPAPPASPPPAKRLYEREVPLDPETLGPLPAAVVKSEIYAALMAKGVWCRPLGSWYNLKAFFHNRRVDWARLRPWLEAGWQGGLVSPLGGLAQALGLRWLLGRAHRLWAGLLGWGARHRLLEGLFGLLYWPYARLLGWLGRRLDRPAVPFLLYLAMVHLPSAPPDERLRDWLAARLGLRISDQRQQNWLDWWRETSVNFQLYGGAKYHKSTWWAEARVTFLSLMLLYRRKPESAEWLLSNQEFLEGLWARLQAFAHRDRARQAEHRAYCRQRFFYYAGLLRRPSLPLLEQWLSFLLGWLLRSLLLLGLVPLLGLGLQLLLWPLRGLLTGLGWCWLFLRELGRTLHECWGWLRDVPEMGRLLFRLYRQEGGSPLAQCQRARPRSLLDRARWGAARVLAKLGDMLPADALSARRYYEENMAEFEESGPEGPLLEWEEIDWLFTYYQRGVAQREDHTIPQHWKEFSQYWQLWALDATVRGWWRGGLSLEKELELEDLMTGQRLHPQLLEQMDEVVDNEEFDWDYDFWLEVMRDNTNHEAAVESYHDIMEGLDQLTTFAPLLYLRQLGAASVAWWYEGRVRFSLWLLERGIRLHSRLHPRLQHLWRFGWIFWACGLLSLLGALSFYFIYCAETQALLASLSNLSNLPEGPANPLPADDYRLRALRVLRKGWPSREGSLAYGTLFAVFLCAWAGVALTYYQMWEISVAQATASVRPAAGPGEASPFYLLEEAAAEPQEENEQNEDMHAAVFAGDLLQVFLVFLVTLHWGDQVITVPEDDPEHWNLDPEGRFERWIDKLKLSRNGEDWDAYQYLDQWMDYGWYLWEELWKLVG